MRIALVLLLLALTGCSGYTRNVLFSDGDRAPAADPSVEALYYDRNGDLYPSGAVPVETRALSTNRRGRSELELRVAPYFEDQRREGGPAWTALLAEAGVEDPGPTTDFGPVWAAVQDGLRDRHVEAVDRRTRRPDGTRRPLVVLIHGFNNVPAEAAEWYGAARGLVRGKAPDAVFMELHWDGLTSNRPPLAWPAAQYNFPLVGLSFRRVLNALDPSIPVRVITHSSGGPLISSTLGDASAPLPSQDATYAEYRRRAAATSGPDRPPNPDDLRVAMIVPAMSSVTFANYSRTSPGPDRLILGLNPRDGVTGKGGFPCTLLGSTCLSADPQLYCRDVAPVLSGIPNVRPYVFDFSRSERNSGYLWFESHGMLAYMERDDMPRVLDLLFNDASMEGGEFSQICEDR